MRFSLRDGPGIRTTVFLKGCPLNCSWCHNPESQFPGRQLMFAAENCIGCGSCVQACPEHAIRWQEGPVRDPQLCTLCSKCVDACVVKARRMAGDWITVPELLARLRRDMVFFEDSGGGVTFSGGEPLHQRQFLLEALQACRANGIHTAVDTCGFAPTEFVEQISDLVDLFLFDLKLVDSRRHREHTGVDNSLILRNLSLLVQRQRPLMVRIPVIPGINDDEENLVGSRVLLSQMGVQKVDLLPYHETGIEKYRRLESVCRLQNVKPPSMETMQALSDDFSRSGFVVRIGG